MQRPVGRVSLCSSFLAIVLCACRPRVHGFFPSPKSRFSSLLVGLREHGLVTESSLLYLEH